MLENAQVKRQSKPVQSHAEGVLLLLIYCSIVCTQLPLCVRAFVSQPLPSDAAQFGGFPCGLGDIIWDVRNMLKYWLYWHPSEPVQGNCPVQEYCQYLLVQSLTHLELLCMQVYVLRCRQKFYVVN